MRSRCLKYVVTFFHLLPYFSSSLHALLPSSYSSIQWTMTGTSLSTRTRTQSHIARWWRVGRGRSRQIWSGGGGRVYSCLVGPSHQHVSPNLTITFLDAIVERLTLKAQDRMWNDDFPFLQSQFASYCSRASVECR